MGFKFNTYIRCYFIAVFLLLNSCNKENHKDKSKIEINSKPTSLVELQKKSLLGKKISSLKEIVTDTLPLGNSVLMIYNGFDCSTCIDIGFNIIKQADSLKKRSFVIGTQSSFHSEQNRNNYHKYIYNDKKDLIRKELNHISTPVLLYINEENQISRVLFPDYNRNEQNLAEEDNFLLHIVEN